MQLMGLFMFHIFTLNADQYQGRRWGVQNEHNLPLSEEQIYEDACTYRAYLQAIGTIDSDYVTPHQNFTVYAKKAALFFWRVKNKLQNDADRLLAISRHYTFSANLLTKYWQRFDDTAIAYAKRMRDEYLLCAWLAMQDDDAARRRLLFGH